MLYPTELRAQPVRTVVDGREARKPAQASFGAGGTSHFLLRSGKTNRLPPHHGPLPFGGGEGEPMAVGPRNWRRKSSNGKRRNIAEPTAPPDSLSPRRG